MDGTGHISAKASASPSHTMENQGRWDEAEKLEVEVMETRKTKLGADHPDTPTSTNNLAFTWKAVNAGCFGPPYIFGGDGASAQYR